MALRKFFPLEGMAFFTILTENVSRGNTYIQTCYYFHSGVIGDYEKRLELAKNEILIQNKRIEELEQHYQEKESNFHFEVSELSCKLEESEKTINELQKIKEILEQKDSEDNDACQNVDNLKETLKEKVGDTMSSRQNFE